MNKVFEKSFYNDIIIDEADSSYSIENRKLLGEIIKKRELLEAELNEKQKAMLDDLAEVTNQETGLFGDHRFERGFQLGVLLMSEIFHDRDSFWTQ